MKHDHHNCKTCQEFVARRAAVEEKVFDLSAVEMLALLFYAGVSNPPVAHPATWGRAGEVHQEMVDAMVSYVTHLKDVVLAELRDESRTLGDLP